MPSRTRTKGRAAMASWAARLIGPKASSGTSSRATIGRRRRLERAHLVSKVQRVGKKGLANRPLIRELLRLCVGSLSSPDRPLQVPPILLPACQPSQLAPTHLGWARGLHWSPGGPPSPPGAPGLHQRGAPGSFGPIHPSSRPRFGGSPLLQIPIPLPPRLSVWRIPDAWPGPPPSVSVSHRRQSAPSPLSAGPPGRRRGQTDTSTRTVQSVLVFVGAALCTFLSTARCHVPGSSTERQFLPGERFSALRTGPA